MAGHSKWKNIQKRKNAQDRKRGRIFMKMAKEIFVAAKQGGGDPDTNPTLRLAVDKAKANNMPNNNIERAIKKATGDLDGAQYEELTYEGYGPGGVAVMVNVLTDNKNRTASEIRHAFNKNNGNLGGNGCVGFMFDRKGYLEVSKDNNDIDEEEMLLAVVEAGGEEMETTEGSYQIYSTPENYTEVKNTLESSGFRLETAEITMIPQNLSSLEKDEGEKLIRLVDMLEDMEDVQEVFHNLDFDASLLHD